jgi:hypothetical protein
MSRSSPGTPLFLAPAWHRIRRLLEETGEPMTPEQVRDALVAEGFQWPTRDSVSSYRQDSPRVTLDKVRRLLLKMWGYGVDRDREGRYSIMPPRSRVR